MLEAPDALEVIAITGNIDSEIASLPPDDAPLAAGEWNYRGMRARPPAVVRDPGARRRVIAGLYRSMVHDDAMANCFAPHHAVRDRRGGRTIELVVCFLCSQAVILTDRGQQVRVAISDAARGPLDDALRTAGVPPPPAGH